MNTKNTRILEIHYPTLSYPHKLYVQYLDKDYSLSDIFEDKITSKELLAGYKIINTESGLSIKEHSYTDFAYISTEKGWCFVSANEDCLKLNVSKFISDMYKATLNEIKMQENRIETDKEELMELERKRDLLFDLF